MCTLHLAYSKYYELYRLDLPILETLLSSLMLTNTRFYHYSEHLSLSYNIQWSYFILLESPEGCYDLSSILSRRHTLVLSNTRKLNRVPKYKCLPFIQTTNGPYYTLLALL